jgi:acetoin utilization protein AcuB
VLATDFRLALDLQLLAGVERAQQPIQRKGTRDWTMKPTIQKYMTPTPHTIGQEQTLQVAHDVMREHGVRHLPVLEGGKLVGLLSQRDLHLVETLREVDPATTTVDEAMTTDVYVTGPDVALDEVAAQMAEHKYGSAVIVDRGKVLGMFTTVDALKAVVSLANAPVRRAAK